MQERKSRDPGSLVDDNNFIVRAMLETDVAAAVSLQHLAFPSLSIDEHLTAEQFCAFIDFFGQGQFVIVHNNRVVATTSTMRCSNDFALRSHSFKNAVELAVCSSYTPVGDWMYGLDIAVLPEYRGLGLARSLYRARQSAVSSCSLCGQYTVGLLSGFATRKSDLSISEYYEQVISGKIWDPVVSIQMKIGFKPLKLVSSYVDDPGCGNCGVLMMLSADTRI